LDKTRQYDAIINCLDTAKLNFCQVLRVHEVSGCR
jgi:hypothetical protein